MRPSRAESPVAALVDFRMRLTEAGLRVSPPELSDAARGMLALPDVLEDRERLRALLKATLVKRLADEAAFDAVFDDFFRELIEPLPHAHHHHHHHDESDAQIVGIDFSSDELPVRVEGEGKHEHGERIDLRRFFGEGAGEAGHDHHDADRLRLTWFGRELTFDHASQPPASLVQRDGVFSLRRVATLGMPGALSESAGRELPRDLVLDGGRHDDWQTTGAPDDVLLGRTEALIADALEGGARNVKRSLAPDRTVATRDLPDLRWDELTAADLKRLEAAAVRLGRRLGGAPGRLRRARQGRLDSSATWRAAASTGGAPFRPVFRERRDDWPRLIVLCDVSLSVRAAAWFMIQVSRAAQRQSGRVRTFVFVRDLADATREMSASEPMSAIRAIFGGDLLDVSAASDAGAALAEWHERFGSMLNRQTTVLILGDGRNNGRDPRVDALAKIAERARRVIWLSPEPRGAWRLAGCDLPLYEPLCDLAASVRTPADLERLVRQFGAA